MFLAREASTAVDIEILVSSILRAHGFAVTSEVLEIRVASVVDPGDYGRSVSAMRSGQGALPLALRFDLAKKAFAHTAV